MRNNKLYEEYLLNKHFCREINQLSTPVMHKTNLKHSVNVD